MVSSGYDGCSLIQKGAVVERLEVHKADRFITFGELGSTDENDRADKAAKNKTLDNSQRTDKDDGANKDSMVYKDGYALVDLYEEELVQRQNLSRTTSNWMWGIISSWIDWFEQRTVDIKQFRVAEVVYINLDDNEERRNSMRSELLKLRLPFRRYPGVTMCAEQARAFADNVADGATDERIMGRAGCLMAHMDVLLYILSIGKDDAFYLVLEDDWVPYPNFTDSLNLALQDSRVPRHFDVARLDVWGECAKFEVSTGRCHCGGTHAMLVTKAGAQRLLDFYSSTAAGPADCHLSDEGAKFGLELLVLNFKLGHFTEERSKSSSIPKTFTNPLLTG
eukprot:CAMPEP_0170604116 /NCGR_PEP_ID=MMETSP0224-20130122/19256_1 /TAXON_ID=285029 /ORGANISM="Togula jolla, Strain CCCM 725" /LENGTH=335 /DNA_ID=CAMNT_0010929007 /DNA_START=116 /DNA_END=1123 /DNA_ORIENTATION=+